jgi:hypothetical protein
MYVQVQRSRRVRKTKAPPAALGRKQTALRPMGSAVIRPVLPVAPFRIRIAFNGENQASTGNPHMDGGQTSESGVPKPGSGGPVLQAECAQQELNGCRAADRRRLAPPFSGE